MPSDQNENTSNVSSDSENDSNISATDSDAENEKIEKCSRVLRKVNAPKGKKDSLSTKKRGRPTKNKKVNKQLNSATNTNDTVPAMQVASTMTSSTSASGVTNESSQTLLDKTLTVSLALEKIRLLENDNVHLRATLREKNEKIIILEQTLDDERQLAKKDTLIFSGPVVDSDSADLQSMMVNNLTTKLRITPEKASTIQFNKLGDAKNIVAAKIESEDTRRDLFKAAKSMKPGDFFISESLTSKRRTLLYQLRKLKKTQRIHSAFSFYGDIFYKQTESGNRIKIKSLREISVIADAYNEEAATNEDLEPIKYEY